MIFGKGKAKTLADLDVGHLIAICTFSGEFVRMGKVAVLTDKTLWTGTHRGGERYSLSTGKEVNGKKLCRIPTQSDLNKQKAHKEKASAQYQGQQRLKALEANEEYQLAKDIGYKLCDFDHGSPAKYLAFAKRIGLDRLRAFKDAIEESME